MHEHDRVKRMLPRFSVGGCSRRQRVGIERHLSGCDECSSELAALMQTGAVLDSMPLEDAPLSVWEGIRRGMADHGGEQLRRRLRWAYAMAAGALTLALIAFGALLLRPVGVQEMPASELMVAEQDMSATIEGHWSTAWAAPLADEAAMGLRFAPEEENG